MQEYIKKILLFSLLVSVVGIIVSYLYSIFHKPEKNEYFLPMIISLFLTGGISYWLNNEYLQL